MDFLNQKEFQAKEWENVPVVVKHWLAKQKIHNDTIIKQIGEKSIGLKIDKNLQYIKQFSVVIETFKQDYQQEFSFLKSKTNSSITQITEEVSEVIKQQKELIDKLEKLTITQITEEVSEVLKQQKEQIDNFEKLKIMDEESNQAQEEQFSLEQFQQLISSKDTKCFQYQITLNIWKLINKFYQAQNLESKIQKIEQHQKYQDEKYDKQNINLQHINDQISQYTQDMQKTLLDQYQTRIHLEGSITNVENNLNILKKAEKTSQDELIQKFIEDNNTQLTEGFAFQIDKINQKFDDIHKTIKSCVKDIEISQIQIQSNKEYFQKVELQFDKKLESQKSQKDEKFIIQVNNLKHTFDQIQEQHMQTTNDLKELIDANQMRVIQDMEQSVIIINNTIQEVYKRDLYKLENLQGDMHNRQISFQKSINQIKEEFQNLIHMTHEEFNNQLHKRIKFHESQLQQKNDTIEKSVKAIVISLQNFAKQRTVSNQISKNNSEAARQITKNNSEAVLQNQATDEFMKNQSSTATDDPYQGVRNQSQQRFMNNVKHLSLKDIQQKNIVWGGSKTQRSIKYNIKNRKIITDESHQTLECQLKNYHLNKRLYSGNIQNLQPAKIQFNLSSDQSSRFFHSRQHSVKINSTIKNFEMQQKFCLENDADNQLNINMEQLGYQLVNFNDEQTFQDQGLQNI